MKCLFLYSNNPLFYFYCESPLFVSFYMRGTGYADWFTEFANFLSLFRSKNASKISLNLGFFFFYYNSTYCQTKLFAGYNKKALISNVHACSSQKKKYFLRMNEKNFSTWFFRLFKFFVNFWMKCNNLWLKSYLAKSLGWCCGEINSRNCWKTQ